MRNPLFLCLIFILSGCWIGNPPKPFAEESVAAPPIAEVKEIRQSPVQVLFLNAKAKQTAKVGTALRPGEIVTTQRSGAVQIKLKGGAIGRIALNAQLQVKSARSMALHYGKLLVWTPTLVHIQTKFGTIVADRAVVYLNFPDSSFATPEIIVLQGKISSSVLDSSTAIPLHAGETLRITPWGLPLPKRPVPLGQKTRWIAQSRALLKFTDRFPTEVSLWQAWEKIPPKPPRRKRPVQRPAPAPLPPYYYEEPYPYNPEPSYAYAEPGRSYDPAPRPRSAPPPPPPPEVVIAEPPPLPIQTEPEIIAPADLAADPLPVAEPAPLPEE